MFPCGLGEDGPGARARGREGCLVEGLGVKFTDPAAGSAQEVAQALGPGVAVGVLDEPEVAQQVGTAQGVLTVISGEGAGPSVVDQNATRAGDDTQVRLEVHRMPRHQRDQRLTPPPPSPWN